MGILVNPGDTPIRAFEFSQQPMPAFGVQPYPDPAMDEFNEFRKEEERKAGLEASKSKENGKDDSQNGDEDNEDDEKSTLSFSVRLMLYLVGVIAGGADGETLMGKDEDFSFRLCANNRLIECIGLDWKPIIRGIPSPKGRFLYPMLIGKLNDEWLIMR